MLICSPSRVTETTGLYLLALGAISLGLGILAVAIHMSQGIQSDPAWGILAAEQATHQFSPDILHLTTANPNDISQVQTKRVMWWAPAYQGVPFLFRRLGYDWGRSIKVVAVSSLAMGMVGWAWYFATIIPYKSRLFWTCLILFLPLRFCWNSSWTYDGGQCLLWAVFPFVFLLNTMIMESRGEGSGSLFLAIAAGFATAMMFLIKFNAALLAAAFFASWMLELFISRRNVVLFAFWTVGAAMGACALLALEFVRPSSGANLAGGLIWEAAWQIPAATLAMTDIDSLLRWLLVHPGRAVLSRGMFVIFSSVCAGSLVIALLPMLLKQRLEFRLRTALAIVGATAAQLAILGFLGGSIDCNARFQRESGLLLFPFVLKTLASRELNNSIFWRFSQLVALSAIFVIPSLYGMSSLIDKGFFRNRTAADLVGPDGIRIDLFSGSSSAKKFYAWLVAAYSGQGRTFYFTSPELALPLATEPLLVVHADFSATSKLARTIYRGRPTKGVILLLPVKFHDSEKNRVIMSSFSALTDWRVEPAPFLSGWELWYGH